PVLAHDAVEEQLRLALHGLRELRVEVRELERVGVDLLEVLKAQPLRGEARGERLGPRIREHAPRLGLQYRRIRQPALAREREKRVVRRATPQEERQSRGQVDV